MRLSVDDRLSSSKKKNAMKKGKNFAAVRIIAGLFFLLGGPVVPRQAVAEDASPPIDAALPAGIILRVAYDDSARWLASVNIKTPAPEHAFAVFFKDYVEETSGGKISVELYGEMALGSYRQTLEMVQDGSLDINIGTGSLSSFFPKMELLSIPYLFISDDIAGEFFDNSPLWARMMEDLEKEAGFKYLAIGQNGWRHFTNDTREIRGPKDMKGIRFRVMASPFT
jgi:C4-dicarboxylate-binding protein DctP